MVRISAKRLASLRSRASGAGRRVGRGVRRQGRRRKSLFKSDLKKGVMGTAAGLAVSVGLTMAGRQMNQPMLTEVGQRAGAVVATWLGGMPGQIGYQIGDGLFDRFVGVGGSSITGQRSLAV